MNVKSCAFTQENIVVFVRDGIVYISNTDDNILYEVVTVKKADTNYSKEEVEWYARMLFGKWWREKTK